MGRMRILFASYRDWSNQIFERLDNKEQFDRVHSQQELLTKNHKEYDLIFFVGWSEIIPDEYISEDNCICLHPSPLPKYRGGSPIQHQIISGETESAVTLFFMNSELDAGDIVFQKEFSLSGELTDIFDRIISVGSEGIAQVISDHKNGKLARSKIAMDTN
jgi:methionyl-tRNA formyltransferase